MKGILCAAFSGRRGKVRIIAEILEETRKPVSKTQIMTKCNLSYRQLKHYLRLMRFKGLIQRKDEEKRVTYSITKAGHNFLSCYNNIALLLQDASNERLSARLGE